MELLLLMVGFIAGVLAEKLPRKDVGMDEYKRELGRLNARKDFENETRTS